MCPEIEVEISDTQGHLRTDRYALEKLVRGVLAAEDRLRGSISIALVDNATIHAVNRTHLGHDWPTDVISFPLSDADDPVFCGELLVSAEMACASARELGVEPHDELALYVVHGLLHLCGYDDRGESDARRMRQREIELLAQAGVTDPYLAVAETNACHTHSTTPESALDRGRREAGQGLGGRVPFVETIPGVRGKV
jgi:probable rRNA maturation factor